MTTPRPSTLATALDNIGLDVKNLPRLRDIPAKQLREVMELFKTSLGLRCRGCHAEKYSDPTPQKKIAEHMWDDFVRRLTLEDGSLVFCDSCHQGKAKTLDRSDKKALGEAMRASFVDKLKRADGQDHKCTTCHASESDFGIFARWQN
jgi:hypothetical protein